MVKPVAPKKRALQATAKRATKKSAHRCDVCGEGSKKDNPVVLINDTKLIKEWAHEKCWALPTKKSAPLRKHEQCEHVNKQHLRSMVRRCELCGKLSKSRKSILPFSRVQHGVDWAHDKCLRKRDKKTPFKPEITDAGDAVYVDPATCEIDERMLAVYRDRNGTTYLRVSRTKRYADLLVCKRWQVERVTMDAKTADSLDLQTVKRASILAQARLLLRPVNCSVTISQRAISTIHNVLGLKEIESMKNQDVAKFATVTGTKKVPAKKPVKTEAPAATKAPKASKKAATKKAPVERAPRLILVKLKKKYKDGKDEKLPAQAQVILQVLESNSGSLTTDKLFSKLEGKLEASQPVARIYAFYRKRLIEAGYITAAKVA